MVRKMRLIDIDGIDWENFDIEMKPVVGAVLRKASDGILWENEVMREQLTDIGKSFGEKMDDVVKVVRCKDCKHSRADDVFGGRWCQFPESIKRVREEFFCANGERKDDE